MVLHCCRNLNPIGYSRQFQFQSLKCYWIFPCEGRPPLADDGKEPKDYLDYFLHLLVWHFIRKATDPALQKLMEEAQLAMFAIPGLPGHLTLTVLQHHANQWLCTGELGVILLVQERGLLKLLGVLHPSVCKGPRRYRVQITVN